MGLDIRIPIGMMLHLGAATDSILQRSGVISARSVSPSTVWGWSLVRRADAVGMRAPRRLLTVGAASRRCASPVPESARDMRASQKGLLRSRTG